VPLSSLPADGDNAQQHYADDCPADHGAGDAPGRGDWKIYVVSADGGSPEQVTPDEALLDPTWSPDESFLAYSSDDSDLHSAVHLVDLRTHHISTVPGSEGLFSPDWSRDGRFLFAISHKLQNSHKLLMYTFATRKWEQLLLAKSISRRVLTTRRCCEAANTYTFSISWRTARHFIVCGSATIS
jgi:tricorn protease-like protein